MKNTFQKIHIILILVIFPLSLSAQWMQMPFPPEGLQANVSCFAKSGTDIFAGTTPYLYSQDGGVYRSINNGINWTLVGLSGTSVISLVVSGTNIFAGISGGVFLSTDNGATWTSAGLHNEYVSSLAVSGTNLFAGTSLFHGLFLSTNNGMNWIQTSLNNQNVCSIVLNGTNLFAGTANSGVFLSTNNGTNWTAVNNGLTCLNVTSVAVSESNMFAGTSYYSNSGVFLSTNNGTNWTAVNNGLTNPYTNAFAVSGVNLFVSNSAGIFLTTNNGEVWLNKNQGLTGPEVNPILIANNYIFIATSYKVWRRSLTEILGIRQISEIIPAKYSLSQNYPNPFNPSTNIKYQITRHSGSSTDNKYVTLKVFDILGKEIVTIVNEKQSPGIYEVNWDASQYPSGVYFYRLVTDGFTDTKKMILLK
jgi:photosystem II stability/assembly factor-like uncharacterized protein